jgi:uncharacterized OB-fold protein
MSEVAEMMLDGTLCQQCGTFIGPPTGHPKTCAACKQKKPKKKKAAAKKSSKGGAA